MSVRTAYLKTARTEYVCDICGAVFPSGPDYAQHVRCRHPEALRYCLGEVLLGRDPADRAHDVMYVQALVCGADGVLRYALSPALRDSGSEVLPEQELERGYVRLNSLSRDELVARLPHGDGKGGEGLEALVMRLMRQTGLGDRLALEPLELRDGYMILRTPVTAILRSLLLELAQGTADRGRPADGR